MLCEHRKVGTGTARRHFGIDSSGRRGYEWFVGREDMSRFPRVTSDDADDHVPSCDANAVLESRLCRLSTIGRLGASIVEQSWNVFARATIESRCAETQLERCREVVSIVADQDIERGGVDIRPMHAGSPAAKNHTEVDARVF